MKRLYFIWAFIERFGANVLSFLGNIVLAYLLVPDDFGVMAMVSLFTGLIVVLVDAGTGDALLQQGTPSRRDFNTVFYFNVAVALALAALYAAIAPAVAWFFNAPELKAVMMSLGIGAVFYGLSVTQFTRLRSQLRFRHVALINLAAVALALAAAITVAAIRRDYWALVTLQIGFPAFSLLLLVMFTRWELRWEFDITKFRQIWAFGVNLLISTFFNLLSQYIFPMILGWKYNTTQAGFMGQAQKLQQTPVNSIETSISLTAFVLISKLKSHAEKCAKVLSTFNAMTLVNTTICMGVIALSQPIIEVLLPDQWLPVIPYLRLLAVWGLVYPVSNHAMMIFKIFNRTSVIRNVFIIEKTAIVIAALMLYPFGVTAIVIAAVFLSAVSLVIYIVMAAKVMEPGCARRLTAIYLRNLAYGGIAAIIAWLVSLAVYHFLTPSFTTSLTALCAGAVPFLPAALKILHYARR